MKKALIVGIGGQDGFYLKNLLLEKGYTVIGLDLNISNVEKNSNLHLFSGSILDSILIIKLINDFCPNEIYNLTGQLSDRKSFDDPKHTLSFICMGTMNILESIRRKKIKFFQATSSEMYGNNPNMPKTGFTEEHEFMPITPYASSKVFAYNLVASYRHEYNLHGSSGILFNHESPLRDDSYLTRKVTTSAAKIKLGLQNELVLGNIESIKDWGFAGDYVEAMWIMLQQKEPDDYIISTGISVSVRDFVKFVFEYADLGDYRKYVKYNETVPKKAIFGDYKKAKNKLGWKPKHNIYDLAKMMYENDLRNLRNEN